MVPLRLPLLAVLLVSSLLEAGDRTNIRALGMARVLGPVARGIHAFGINPANLALPDNSRFGLSFLPFGVRISSNLISYDIYQEYFTGVLQPDGSRKPRYLNTEDKMRILESMESGLGTTRMDVDAIIVGMSFSFRGRIGVGFSVSDHLGGKLVLPKDYARFFLFGLDSSGSKYVFDGTEVSAWWWREFNVSAGMAIPVELNPFEDFYAGVGVKVLKGYGMIQTSHYRASIANVPLGGNQYRADLKFDYLTRRSGIDFFRESSNEIPIFPMPAGNGFAVDLGLACTIRGISLHLGVSDIGTVRWKRNLTETYGSYNLSIDDPLSQANEDSIQEAGKGKNRPGGEFTTSLPTILRLGAAMSSDRTPLLHFLPGELFVAAEYQQGLSSSMGGTTTPRLALGLEYKVISFLPLRTGVSVGGDEPFRWAAGIGLDFEYVRVDVATENVGILFFPNQLTMISLAAGLEIRF